MPYTDVFMIKTGILSKHIHWKMPGKIEMDCRLLPKAG